MKKISLPDDLNLHDLQTIQLFEYLSTEDIVKQQIVLNQNAFSFLMDGGKEVVFDSITLSVDNAQFLILKSGNFLMTQKLSYQRVYSILLFFSNQNILNFMQKNKISIKKPIDFKPVFSFFKDDFIQRYAMSLLDILKFSKELQIKLLEIKFEEIMIYLTSKYGNEFLYSLLENNNKSQKKIKQIVESNWSNKLTLKQLAFLSNMSVSSFKREFAKCYAQSPIKWFQNKRLEYANYLIHQENKTSSDIYLEIGFESLSSFIQAYKSKYGITPKQHYKN